MSFKLVFEFFCATTTLTASTYSSKSTTRRSSSTALPPTPVSDGKGPIIKQSDRKAQYQRDLKIILGTVVGVVCVFAAFFIGLCWWNRRPRQRGRGRQDGTDSEMFNQLGSVSADKQCPSVLLLYARDFPAHVRCVTALGCWLLQDAGCDVHLDVWETELIQQQGRLSWFRERLQSSDFILVVSSTAARLLAQHRFPQTQQSTLPADPFPQLLAPVLNELNQHMNKELPLDRFMVLRFPYTSSGDMPAANLELARCLQVPADLSQLCGLLHRQERRRSSSDRAPSELEARLKQAVSQAQQYITDNPGWVYELFEPAPGPSAISSERRIVTSSSGMQQRSWRSQTFIPGDAENSEGSSAASGTLPRRAALLIRRSGSGSVSSSASSSASRCRQRRHTISDWVFADVHAREEPQQSEAAPVFTEDLSLPCMDCGANICFSPLQLPICSLCYRDPGPLKPPTDPAAPAAGSSFPPANSTQGHSKPLPPIQLIPLSESKGFVV